MSTVDCPYCEHENEVDDYLSDSGGNKFDCLCDSCEKEFEVEVEWEPSFSASEIIFEDCQACGKSTRDPYKKGRVFPYPKFLKHDVLCESCWLAAYRKELEDRQHGLEADSK